MSLLPPAFAVLLLLVALPTGFMLTAGLLPARSLLARLGTATLAGIGAIAAISHALMALGVRSASSVPLLVAVGAIGGSLFLWKRARRRGPVDAPRGLTLGRVLAIDVLLAVIVALLLAVPFVEARGSGISEGDAVRIWMPKAVRAWTQAPPVLWGEEVHAHPEYPRGLGIVTAALAAPSSRIDSRLPRLAGIALFALLLLVAFDALSSRGNVWGAFAAVLILGCLPPVLRHAGSGMADVPIAGFILLGCFGLAPQKDGRPAILTALAGGLGALVIKDEGLAFHAALTVVLVISLARDRRPAAALAVVAVSAALAAPWVALRSGTHGGEPLVLGSLWQNAGLVLLRLDLIARELGHLAFGLPDPSPAGITLPDVVPGGDLVVWTAVGCAVVLVTGRRPHLPVLPFGILLLADVGVIALTAVGVEWQMVTAYNRLLLQGLPLLVVAALDKLTTPGADADGMIEATRASAAA